MSQFEPQIEETLFNNLTHTAKAMGVAKTRVGSRRKATVHYVSFAGTNTACESIRASLHKKDARMPYSHWTPKEEFVVPGMQLAKARLPNSAEIHMLLWDPDPHFLVERSDRYFQIRHGYLASIDPRRQEREMLLEAARRRLALRLIDAVNKLTPAPVIPEWAERLYQSAANHGYQRLHCEGDCIAAMLLVPEFDWVEHVKREMRDLYISIPPLDPSLVERLKAMQDAAELAHDASVVDADAGDREPGEPLAKLLTDSQHPAAVSAADDAGELHGQPLEALLEGEPLKVCTVDLRRPLFDLGQLVATPGFLDAAGDIEWVRFLERHVTGDWRETDDAGNPELDPFDINQNRAALNPKHPQRILSAFWLPTEPEPTKFWIITEHDRSVTTCLLPAEY